MRKKIIILIFVLCICIIPKYKAQTYFNNRYDTFGSCDGTNSIDTMFGGYISAGTTCSSLSFSTFQISKYSLTGNKIAQRVFVKPNNFLPNKHKYIKTNNNHFFVSGVRFYKQDTSLCFLWRFNSNLDSVKYYEYGYLNKTNVTYSFIKHSKYIYLVGYTDSINTNSDILLIKIDTLGNEIWKKKIGITGWDEQAYSVKITQDNNLIIAGYKKYHTNATSGDYILKIDTSGSVLWDRYYASSNYASGSLDILELPNGNYVFTGDDAFGNSPQGVLRKPTLGLLTPNGSLLWRKNYGGQFPGHDFYSILLNERGNIVACGQKGMSDNSLNGIIYEVTQNGDSLFSREYYYQSGCQNYFRDIIQTDDGGYCLGGFFIPTFANGCTGSQDIWLLKIDSNFCEGNFNCGYPTNNISSAEIQGNFKIYPNPSSSLINIESSVFGVEVQLQISNSFGQVIQNIPLTQNKSSISTINLSNGIYHYQIIKNQQILLNNKLIILK